MVGRQHHGGELAHALGGRRLRKLREQEGGYPTSLPAISMPVMNGIEAARRLKGKHPEVKIVFITMHADPAYVRAAFKAGASAYLLKRSVGEELSQALRAVDSGNYYVTPLVTREVIDGLLRGTDAAPSQGSELTHTSTRGVAVAS